MQQGRTHRHTTAKPPEFMYAFMVTTLELTATRALDKTRYRSFSVTKPFDLSTSKKPPKTPKQNTNQPNKPTQHLLAFRIREKSLRMSV